MTNLQIGFMNVRGLADKKKRADVFAWLRNKHCDIICLADIHSNQSKVKVGVLRPVQQPGSYWDRSSELPLVGLEPTEVTAYD